MHSFNTIFFVVTTKHRMIGQCSQHFCDTTKDDVKASTTLQMLHQYNSKSCSDSARLYKAK